MRPPQQNPVTASLRWSPLLDFAAQAAVASRSDMTCASGTLFTTSREDLLPVADLRDVALAGIEFRGDGAVPQLGEAPANVLDVLVHAEDFLHDQHDREILARGGHRAIRGNLTVGDRDLDFTGLEAFGAGRDRLRGDRLHGQRKARGERGHQHLPPRQRALAEQRIEIGVGPLIVHVRVPPCRVVSPARRRAGKVRPPRQRLAPPRAARRSA